MKSNNPVIIGYDAISPLGLHLDDQWQRAVLGESGIGPLDRFSYGPDFPVQIAGQVPDIDQEPYPFLSPRRQACWSSPIFKYALLSVVRALERSGLPVTPEIAPRLAVTYSSAIGGIDAVLTADRRLQSEGKLPHPYANPNSCINMVGGRIAIETGARGPITTTVTACATGLTSILVGAMYLAQGRADAAICGAADFALVEPIVAGFSTMNGTYAPKPGQPVEAPAAASRPFSKNRRGFVISEGAGAVIIATPEFARRHGLDYQIELAGWGMTSDAYHIVAPYFETVRRCMEEAIQDAGVAPQDIAAVNAHAASTRVGDLVESQALEAVFGTALPPVSANKSLIGHTMGAASVVESILAMHGMSHDLLLPTINHRPDPEIPLDCVAEGSRSLSQEFVLKNAFGFGGCNACAVFRRVC